MRDKAAQDAAACAGKEKFESPQKVAKAIKAMQQRRPKKNGRGVASPGKLGHYRCDHCGYWHVGTPEFTVSSRRAMTGRER